MYEKLKYIFSKITKKGAIAIIIIIAIAFMLPFYIYSERSSKKYSEKEDNLVNNARITTKYVVDAYNLYYDSGQAKFNESINSISEITSNSFTGFQLISMKNEILFDSRSNDLNTDNPRQADIPLDVLHSREIFVDKNNRNHIRQLIVPHRDNWGNHYYSVRYFPNYVEVEAELSRYRSMMILLGGGIFLVGVFVLIVVHFSERIEVEKERTEKLRDINNIKDEFMNIVSHNLRTPLTITKGYLSFLETEKKTKKERESIEKVEKGVEKLSQLVEDIVLATEILNNKKIFAKEKVNVKNLIEEIEAEHSKEIKEKNIDFKINTSGKSGFKGDRAMVKRAIANLIDNAIRYNKDKGKVKIEIENFSKLKVRVKDTGEGIKEERMESLIGLFHRGENPLSYNTEGEGIGLYLTDLIVKHYNGEINVESKKGAGSTFEIIMKEID